MAGENEIKKVKIKDLPKATTLNDTDIFVESDSLNTYKITADDLAKYIKASQWLMNYYAHKESIGVANGIAPLNSSSKINGQFITYGTTASTAYEGSSGKVLEQNLDAHILDKNAHGLENVDNTSDMNKPVSTAQQNAIDLAYASANGYTNTKISSLINGAPETLDTLKEIADAIAENETVVDAIDSAIGTKANQTELDSHTGNNTVHITSTERTNWNDANSKKHTHSNKSVLDGITSALITTWNTVSNKVDKISGKGLSTNDLTNAMKSNYDTAYANNHTHSNKSTIDKLSESEGILLFNGEQVQGGGGSEYTHPKPTRTNTTSAASPTHGGTVTVIDSITSNPEGHVTGVNTKTITLPSDNNTDTKVTNTLATTTKAYVTGTTSATTNTGTQVFDTGVYLDTTAGKLHATTFEGALNGTASKATNDANGNQIVNELISTSEPSSTKQKVGDYWMLEY